MIEVKYQAIEEVQVCIGGKQDGFYRLTVAEARLLHQKLGEILYGSEDTPKLVRG